LKLHGNESRSRTRFIKIISDRVKELDEERIRIAKEYSKNDKGEIEYITKDGKKTTDGKVQNASFDIKDIDSFMKEWEEYLNEDYIIDVTSANNDIINGVKSILLNTNEEFEGREAVRYDEWCEAFESIWEKPKKKSEGLKKVDKEAPEAVKDLVKEKEKE